MENPSIYVADLAAYNNGILHGVWIDATLDIDDIWQALKEMLKASPLGSEAEEWAIHDYVGFGSVRISEYQGIESAHEMAVFVEEYGELGAVVLENFHGDVVQATKALGEDYAGQYESLADFAQELTEETSEVPENLAFYIDYEAMGRDFELGGDVFTIESSYQEVHIFWNN
ncbi:antirestriction protein ArdA [Shimia sp. MMG029]|uniref:antirestriction protein ArdA n=1 Tax=Shimia sp. MMG029 TaxID=3021978 RepID=UPI0022FDBCE3|nr:antirestriction protein ArdA [Shimia sp. MMG029]MDA5555790.1 antirestriction protein ArdA [Shimia sp. MMG029]